MNTNPNQEMDRLLVKCLLDEATEAERTAVDRWCGAAPENQRYFEDFRRIWMESLQLAPDVTTDETEAWERFRRSERFPGAGGRRGGTVRQGNFGTYTYMAAAVIVLLVGIGLWWTFSGGTTYTLQAGAQVRTDTLPDGTEVTLNRNSSLVCPRQFPGDARTVKLNGEGFFQVKHQARPFVVRLNGVTIRDLGTSFDVKSGEGGTEIVVESGEVEVSSGNYRVRAGAGEKVVVAAFAVAPRKAVAVDQLYQYYRTRQFVCRETPLRELTDVLNEAYNVHIVIPDAKVQELPYTATFRDEDLDSILDIIARTFSLTVSRNGREITLQPRN